MGRPKKTEKQKKMDNLVRFVEKNPDLIKNIETFRKQVEESKPLTNPSIILKGGIEEINLVKLSPTAIERLLFLHPTIPRGIEIKANRMTSRGHRIQPKDDSVEAVKASDAMRELIECSGGEILINNWIQDGFAFGNGYLTLVPDEDATEIVSLLPEHPVFFRIARSKASENKPRENGQLPERADFTAEFGEMKIDPKTKKPSKYTQVVFSSNKNEVIPTGNELDPDQVAHLVFDTWGDEAEGISLIQYVHLVLKYLLNIEEAGAQAIFRSGFTQKVVNTNAKNENDLKNIARNVSQINSSDAIILPDGTTITNLIPGTTEFVAVHDVFLTLVAMRLGIPKPILTLDGTDINKATMSELMKDMIYDIRAEEIAVKRTIEHQIFRPACRKLFGDDFEKFPLFFFNDFVQSVEEKAGALSGTADYVTKFVSAFKSLTEQGRPEEAEKIMQYMMVNLVDADMTNLDAYNFGIKVDTSEPARVKKTEQQPQEKVPADTDTEGRDTDTE